MKFPLKTAALAAAALSLAACVVEPLPPGPPVAAAPGVVAAPAYPAPYYGCCYTYPEYPPYYGYGYGYYGPSVVLGFGDHDHGHYHHWR